MKSITHTKTVLADYLGSQAGWRSRKADEHPDADRNLKWADALVTLSDYILALPEDHPALQRIHGLWSNYDLDNFDATGDAQHLASQADASDPEVWLEQLADAYLAEETEMWRESMHPDPLPWADLLDAQALDEYKERVDA